MKVDNVQVVALVIKVGPSAADYNTSYSGEVLMNIYIVKHHFHDRIIVLATNYTELAASPSAYPLPKQLWP